MRHGICVGNTGCDIHNQVVIPGLNIVIQFFFYPRYDDQKTASICAERDPSVAEAHLSGINALLQRGYVGNYDGHLRGDVFKITLSAVAVASGVPGVFVHSVVNC